MSRAEYARWEAKRIVADADTLADYEAALIDLPEDVASEVDRLLARLRR